MALLGFKILPQWTLTKLRVLSIYIVVLELGKNEVLLVLPTMASTVQSADKLFEIPFDTSYHAKQAAT